VRFSSSEEDANNRPLKKASPLMWRFLLARIGLLIPTFIGVSIISFVFIRLLPGDPILLLAGERGMSPERYVGLRAAYGYDRPIIVQYLDYLWGIVRGNLGTSIVTRRPVLDEFLTLFPATLELSFCAILFAVAVGIPAGVFAALKRGSIMDQAIMTTALVGFSMPIFWWGLLLIILFSGVLQWTPVSGRISLIYFFPSVTGFMLIDSLISGQDGAFTSAVRHLILPAIVLGTIPLAVIARQTRSAMLEVLNEDYVRTARAKGLPPRRVIGLHALRNALIPVVTTIGLQVGVLLAGAILTETIFSWPGVGKWMVDSVFRRDYPVVQGGLLLIAGIVMIVNLIVDLLYGLINPRIRYR
jgi:dipeptide transport system permease protein